MRTRSVVAVWISCGAASAVAGKLALQDYGDEYDVRLVNNPVKEEDEDNRRFLRDLEQWYGHEIESATNPRYSDNSIESVFWHKQAMSFPHGAVCTDRLKKRARQLWENVHLPDWHVLGFTAEEYRRHSRFTLTERENVLPLLIEYGYTKQDCFDIVRRAGIPLPRVYALGHPNANCIGCIKASSPEYWNFIRRIRPDVFEQRQFLSRVLGVRLVRYRGERIFLDELPADARGRPMKQYEVECGTFCEERE